MQSFHTESDDTPQPEDGEQSFQVCGIDALPPGACRRFTLPNSDEIAIYNVNGEYYATENFCPHRGAPLSEGVMCGHIVECGLHGWQFDVRTGECLTVREEIKTFVVGVEEGMVIVEVRKN
jgi:nitrite reductase/ring-hydroxylating ferredoxin subunit